MNRPDGPCIVGSIKVKPDGYVQVRQNGRLRYGHVIAWEDANGSVPPGMEVEHKCLNRACRNVDHLRLATRSQNMANQGKKKGTFSSPFKGVSWEKESQRWVAQIMFNGKTHRLGRFKSEKDAALAYDAGAVEFWGEFALTNFSKESGNV